MKRTLVFIFLVLLLGLFASTASAAPSTNGSTGLITTPTADVLRPGKFAAGYYNLKDGGSGILNLNLANNLEAGVAGFRYDDSHKNKTFVNTKYNLIPEKVLIPGIAVGIEDIGGDERRTAYAVASKTLPLGFRIHLGAGNGRYNGVFGALEKTISPISVVTGNNTFPATTLIAEYDGHKMNYGARVSIIPGIKFDAGWRERAFYFGLSVTR